MRTLFKQALAMTIFLVVFIVGGTAIIALGWGIVGGLGRLWWPLAFLAIPVVPFAIALFGISIVKLAERLMDWAEDD